ncbi:hypothetical protein BDP27DRAFT_1228894, partial [Rhodocollybia butyracea]
MTGALADVELDLKDCYAETHRWQSETHVAQTSHRIQFLQTQLQRLEDYKACIHSLNSPVHRIPNETLLEIIDYACDMNEITLNLKDMPALAISGVCSRWRALSSSSPRIWSHIRISLNTLDSALSGLSTFPLWKHFLNLSQQSPLTIEI